MNMQNLTFKVISSADLDAYVDMRMDFILEMQPVHDAAEIAEFRKATEEYFDKQIRCGNFVGYIGYAEKIHVCCAGFLLYEQPCLPGKLQRKVGHMHNVYTIPSMRQKGIGEKLIRFIVEDAKTRGFYKITLNATKMGELLYNKCGFADPKERYMELNL